MERKESDSDFWRLHQQLGECYELEIQHMRDELWRLTELLPVPEPSPSRASRVSRVSRLSRDSRSSRASRILAPTKVKSFAMDAPPDDEVQLLDLNQPGSLWNSKAFQQDLQACLARKRTLDALVAGAELAHSSEEPAEELVFRPRSFWIEESTSLDNEQISRVINDRRTRKSSAFSMPAITSSQAQKNQSSCLWSYFRWLQHPGSGFRTWWDALGMMMLAYDLVVIPLRVFDIGESVLLTVMFWVAHLYWNLSIPLSFITGYDDGGILVLDLRKTAKNYITSWFIFDLSLVTLDWTIIALDPSSAGVARLSRTARSLRFLRLLRLGRAVRVRSVIYAIQEQLSSRMANIQYSIFKIIIQLVVSNHIIACLWFGLGALNPESSWVSDSQMMSKSPAYQYATSLHWAFSQLGVGQTEIEAVNLNERIFSVVISFLGFMNFTTMVSSMTSLLARLQKMKNREVEQFTLLRRFLANNQIDPDLSHRVTRFLQHAYTLKHMAMSKDTQIPILEMLSKPLQEELQLQRHRDCLSESHFLSKLQHGSTTFHRVLCDLVTSCMVHTVLALDDVAFAAGTVAAACFYVADGTCLYENQADHSGGLVPEKLSNTWVAEACLWTPWIHVGNLVSQDITRLIAIQVMSFCECIAKDHGARRMASSYALDFVRRLNKKKRWSDVQSNTRTVPTAVVEPNRSGKWCPWRRPIFSKILPS